MSPARLKTIVAQIAKALDELTVPTTPTRPLTVAEKQSYGTAILAAILSRETIEIP